MPTVMSDSRCLLAGEYTKARHAIPAIACYALVAPVVMLIYARRSCAVERRRAAAA